MKTIMKLMVVSLMSVLGMAVFASAPKYGLNESQKRKFNMLKGNEAEVQSALNKAEFNSKEKAEALNALEAIYFPLCKINLIHYKAKVVDALNKLNQTDKLEGGAPAAVEAAKKILSAE